MFADETVASLTRELAADPDNAKLLHARGRAWRRINENEKAIVDYDRALSLGMRTASLRNDMGVAWWHRGDAKRALAEFDVALALDPDHSLALINRGDWYERSEQLDRAAADFARVIEVQTGILRQRPNDLAALTMRGAAANRGGRLDEALADLNYAATLPGVTAKVFRHRGEVLHKLGRHADAIADFDRSLESDPHNPIAIGLRESAASSLAGDAG